ncbi:MAG TPA: anti-sigma factor [Chitinophagaceae bacterium]|nr:anti-sigma factor [Chitinophagaceae bacterium]
MNIEEYISSGIIENYILGLTSSEENQSVETMAATYPEIRDVIASYQKALGEYSNLHAVQPPSTLKPRILNAIRREQDLSPVTTDAKIIPKENTGFHALRTWKRIAAAAILLLIGSVVINSIYIGKYQKSRDRYTALVQSQQLLVTRNQTIETRLEKVESDMQVLMNPAMRPVVMEGGDKHPGMMATVYWDPHNRNTYLGTTNLPVPPTGMAYQLWAIVDGKPVNMGMYNPATEKGPLAMKELAAGQVQAFAITLEKQVGSSTPTMDQMYVIGKI